MTLSTAALGAMAALPHELFALGVAACLGQSELTRLHMTCKVNR